MTVATAAVAAPVHFDVQAWFAHETLEPSELAPDDLEPDEPPAGDPRDLAPWMPCDELDSSSVTVTRRPPKRARARWGLRVCLLAVLVVGEMTFAYRGMIHRPRDASDAVGMLQAVAADLSPGSGTSRKASLASSSAASAPPASAPSAASAPPVADVDNPAAAPARVVAPAPSGAQPIPPDMGLFDPGDAPPGHRIFVDGRTVGQTPQSVLVKCGKATVKIGSAGQPQALDIPCGGKLTAGDP
jgi:serine/threonine-protein kinase